MEGRGSVTFILSQLNKMCRISQNVQNQPEAAQANRRRRVRLK
jgi:hypothetical protein